MKKILAKFPSTCPDSGRRIRKGDPIYYDYTERKAYHPESGKVKEWESQQEASQEARSVSGYIQAQEDAMFERY